jgi:hypothetical protein
MERSPAKGEQPLQRSGICITPHHLTTSRMCSCRSENYLINKVTDQTPEQLELQPITVERVLMGGSSSAAAPAPVPGPVAQLNFTQAAALIAANITATGAPGPHQGIGADTSLNWAETLQW